MKRKVLNDLIKTLRRGQRQKSIVRYQNYSIDIFTGAHMLVVLKSLSKKNKMKVESMIQTPQGFMRFINIVWKVTK